MDPPLLMQHEFAREMEWNDWAGVRHQLDACWAYVVGPARRLEGCTAGTRDDGNDGKTVADFKVEVNQFISRRRFWQAGSIKLALSFLPESKGVVAACSWAWETDEALLPEAQALLTTEEVLAVRL